MGVVSEPGDEGGEQLTLLRGRTRRPGRPPGQRPAPELAADQPVARIVVDVGLAHLDRPFDYAVPATMAETAQPGARVRVRFSGKLVDGFVVARADGSDHEGRLAPLHKVVSPERVLAPEIADLARAVADRYAGTLADVLRLAVPARHARAEAAKPTPATDPATPPGPPPADAARWSAYEHGPALLRALAAGGTPRAVWQALPGAGWPHEVAHLAAVTLTAGRGALVVVPDRRDVARVDAALTAALGEGRHVVLTADLGPAERYTRWLAVRRGSVRVVVGTRAAMFAPVHDLGLAVVWDDGDDLHAEPRAPYPHTREVLALRSAHEHAALVVGGFARTAETAALIEAGWARSVAATRAEVRRAAPAARVAGDDADLARDEGARAARLPSLAWQTARDALENGPVLVQVPRAGYVRSLSCTDCRGPARCVACHGPLATAGRHESLTCSWCGVVAATWACPRCGGRSTRAGVVGAARTAEELGRAFPRTVVRTSGGADVLDAVGPEPALVVATPGAEPVAEDGYAAALLLDGWALLNRPDLRAGEETLRRWMAAAALVRPASRHGRVVVVLADSAAGPAQALLRWDPATQAERELAERTSLQLPPAVTMASLTGARAALEDFVEAAQLPASVTVLGPVPVPDTSAGDAAERLLLRVPRSDRRALADTLRQASGVRSAHKASGSVRVQIDPLEIA